MIREKYEEMYETKKKMDDLVTAKEAGLPYDEQELKRLTEHREKLFWEAQTDLLLTDPETYWCLRARFYEGMSYRQIMLIVFEGLKCESHARKKISRYFKNRDTQ